MTPPLFGVAQSAVSTIPVPGKGVYWPKNPSTSIDSYLSVAGLALAAFGIAVATRNVASVRSLAARGVRTLSTVSRERFLVGSGHFPTRAEALELVRREIEAARASGYGPVFYADIDGFMVNTRARSTIVMRTWAERFDGPDAPKIREAFLHPANKAALQGWDAAAVFRILGIKNDVAAGAAQVFHQQNLFAPWALAEDVPIAPNLAFILAVKHSGARLAFLTMRSAEEVAPTRKVLQRWGLLGGINRPHRGSWLFTQPQPVTNWQREPLKADQFADCWTQMQNGIPLRLVGGADNDWRQIAGFARFVDPSNGQHPVLFHVLGDTPPYVRHLIPERHPYILEIDPRQFPPI